MNLISIGSILMCVVSINKVDLNGNLYHDPIQMKGKLFKIAQDDFFVEFSKSYKKLGIIIETEENGLLNKTLRKVNGNSCLLVK